MIREPQSKKACSRCRVVKTLSEFGARSESFDNRASRCKTCQREDQRKRQAARRMANPDRKKEKYKQDTPFGDARLLSRPMGEWAAED